MRRTPWFERHFPPIADNGLLPGILERLDGTPHRLRVLLAGVERSERAREGWSLAQELGHLNDLEPLWLQRADDIEQGRPDLTVTDLTNRRTFDAGHDEQPIPALIARFEASRRVLVARLRAADDAALERSARHPRLGTPMRLIDLAFFVAEHDDHHLVQLRTLRDGRTRA